MHPGYCIWRKANHTTINTEELAISRSAFQVLILLEFDIGYYPNTECIPLKMFSQCFPSYLYTVYVDTPMQDRVYRIGHTYSICSTNFLFYLLR